MSYYYEEEYEEFNQLGIMGLLIIFLIGFCTSAFFGMLLIYTFPEVFEPLIKNFTNLIVVLINLF